MNKLKTAKLLLVLAAMFFIVKPFLGFSVLTQNIESRHADNILVKVFSKRKPEFLDDAQEKKTALVQQLGQPPLKLLFSIRKLINLLFPLVLVTFSFTNRFLQQLFLKLLPDKQTYLLTGKLTI